MYNSAKFGNIAVKYQAGMYMIETGNGDNKRPQYNEYKKGQSILIPLRNPFLDRTIVHFVRYDPNERKIYLKIREDDIYECSEEEFHKLVGVRKDADFVIGVPEPVMIDGKTGMPYTNMATDYVFLYELDGYEWDLFKFIHADFSKEDEVAIIMETESTPHDCRILKFTKNDNGTYNIDNPPELHLHSYYERRAETLE